MKVLNSIKHHLKETGELKVWSRRGGFTRYAVPLDDNKDT